MRDWSVYVDPSSGLNGQGYVQHLANRLYHGLEYVQSIEHTAAAALSVNQIDRAPEIQIDVVHVDLMIQQLSASRQHSRIIAAELHAEDIFALVSLH